MNSLEKIYPGNSSRKDYEGILLGIKEMETKIMNEVYYEVMVTKKTSPLMTALKIFCIGMTVVCVMAMFIGILWALLLAVVFGVVAYLLKLFNSVEYEYLYIDKELQIDRILSKNSRKRMETLDLNKLEVLAPIRSHELDRYRNRNVKIKDYSSGVEENNVLKYMLVMNDKQIIFEPTEEMVKTIKMFAPRKVFTY